MRLVVTAPTGKKGPAAETLPPTKRLLAGARPRDGGRGTRRLTSLRPRLVEDAKAALPAADGIAALDQIPRAAVPAAVLDAAHDGDARGRGHARRGGGGVHCRAERRVRGVGGVKVGNGLLGFNE